MEFSIGTTCTNDCGILNGSIIHNLPEVTSNQGINGGLSRVECSVIGDGSTRVILCINIGPLIIRSRYFIGFKITLINTAVLHPNFSNMYAYLLDTKKIRYASPIIDNQRISLQPTITLSSNREFFVAGTANTAISSQIVPQGQP